MTSYSIVAELSCFKVLCWPMPRHLLCSYFETAAAINGLDIVGLRKAPRSARGVRPVRDPAHAEGSQETHARSDPEQRELFPRSMARNRRLQSRRCAADDPVAGSHRADDRRAGGAIPRPLCDRGRRHGSARDSDLNAHLAALQEQWQALRMFYIRRDDAFGLYDDDGSFKEERFRNPRRQPRLGHQLAAHHTPASSP